MGEKLRGKAMHEAFKAMANRPPLIERITTLRNQLIKLASDPDPTVAENAKQTFLFVDSEIERLIRIGRKVTHGKPQKMRDAKAERKLKKEKEHREIAKEALEWARYQFPTAAADGSISYLKNKAAEHVSISPRQFQRWLGGK